MNINFVLDKIIRVLLVCVICIMLTISAIFVIPPVYAVDNFDNQPLPVQQYILYPTDNVALLFGHNSDFNGYITNRMGTVDMYAFLWKYSDSQTCLTVCYDDNGTNQVFMFMSIGQTSGTQKYCNTVNETYDLRYNVDIIMSNDGITWDIPYFNTQDEGFHAVRNKIDGVVDPVTSLYEGFRLPAGYLAAIQGSSVSFDMFTDMPEYSSIKQWAYSTQRYGIESSLPSQASFDYDYGTRIIWHITGDTNLLGEGYHAAASLSQSVGSGYLFLVNPAYYGSTANIMNADMFNGVVTLSNVQGIDSIRLYSLGSYIGSGGITSDYSTSSAINNSSVVATNGGFYIENSDGSLTPVTDLPSFGDTSTDGSSSGLIAKFRAILEGVVEKIESLLIAPVEYINRLIVAASNFFAWLSGLWSWLPPAVSGVLTSVLYIMAIVGALKLLWR